MNVLILFYFLSIDECEGRLALKTDQLFPALEKKILQTPGPDTLLCQGRQGEVIGCFYTVGTSHSDVIPDTHFVLLALFHQSVWYGMVMETNPRSCILLLFPLLIETYFAGFLANVSRVPVSLEPLHSQSITSWHIFQTSAAVKKYIYFFYYPLLSAVFFSALLFFVIMVHTESKTAILCMLLKYSIKS